MIEYFYQSDFKLEREGAVSEWISEVIKTEGKAEGDISYIFCDDEYLLGLNKEYLDHDTLTDIISFDYSLGDEIHGEIYISIERVIENSEAFKNSFTDELHRVMIHGILHYCGYGDKTKSDKTVMRSKEDACLVKRNFV
jgi:rRNA maturation RNase YbeY